MSEFIHYDHCPVCSGRDLRPVFEVVDQLVSKRSFSLIECGNCGVRVTQDAPDASSSAGYYQSDAYISHSNTREGAINRIYQLVRRRTLRQKLRMVESFTGLSGGRALDVGSGTGAFVSTLRHAGWRADGIEPDDTARQVALKDFGISLFEADRLRDLPDGEYDVITLWHVLEHVHELSDYMRTFRRLLKPGGRLLLALPNHRSWDAGYFQQWWAAWDVPRHLYHFSPTGVRALSKVHGFECRSLRPMWYDAFYISLLSHQHRDGRSRWGMSLLVGLRSNLQAWFDREKTSSLVYELKPIQ